MFVLGKISRRGIFFLYPKESESPKESSALTLIMPAQAIKRRTINLLINARGSSWSCFLPRPRGSYLENRFENIIRARARARVKILNTQPLRVNYRACNHYAARELVKMPRESVAPMVAEGLELNSARYRNVSGARYSVLIVGQADLLLYFAGN